MDTAFVVISGYSGSGKSTALNTLEDLGYYSVDNLPAELLPSFIHLVETGNSGIHRAALVLDVRGGESVQQYPKIIRSLRDSGTRMTVVFLEASKPVLQQRFSETRRVHPLDPGLPLGEALDREMEILLPLQIEADIRLDTSDLGVHDLRRLIRDRFGTDGGDGRMLVSFMSFGFKYGLPREADLVFDVRFLPNPFFVEELRELDGRDERVQDFVYDSDDAASFFQRTVDFIEYLLPMYEHEGRGYLTVALGCTGGQHRSVALVEKMAASFRDGEGPNVQLRHRELEGG
jgi:UPF0042 nucleotide-binding protein